MIILTTFGRPGYLRRAMESGALGFVVKDAPAEQLAERGPPGRGRRAGGRPGAGRRRPWPAGRRRSPAASATCWSPPAAAPRWPTSPPASFLSEGTVRNYLSAAIAKTGVRNRIEAMRVADDRGWL